jgi:transcriptional regulator with XRE-family HTH domain
VRPKKQRARKWPTSAANKAARRQETAEINLAFGNQLRSLREARGLDQETLALECGIDRTFVSQMERGIRQASLTTLYRLADALKVPVTELVRCVDALMEKKPSRND